MWSIQSNIHSPESYPSGRQIASCSHLFLIECFSKNYFEPLPKIKLHESPNPNESFSQKLMNWWFLVREEQARKFSACPKPLSWCVRRLIGKAFFIVAGPRFYLCSQLHKSLNAHHVCTHTHINLFWSLSIWSDKSFHFAKRKKKSVFSPFPGRNGKICKWCSSCGTQSVISNGNKMIIVAGLVQAIFKVF